MYESCSSIFEEDYLAGRSRRRNVSRAIPSAAASRSRPSTREVDQFDNDEPLRRRRQAPEDRNTNQSERNFVFVDSVNALAIYNDDRMLAEYLHTFINTFRQQEVLSVILNVPDQTPPLVLSNLDLYCTDLVDRGQVVIH